MYCRLYMADVRFAVLEKLFIFWMMHLQFGHRWSDLFETALEASGCRLPAHFIADRRCHRQNTIHCSSICYLPCVLSMFSWCVYFDHTMHSAASLFFFGGGGAFEYHLLFWKEAFIEKKAVLSAVNNKHTFSLNLGRKKCAWHSECFVQADEWQHFLLHPQWSLCIQMNA